MAPSRLAGAATSRSSSRPYARGLTAVWHGAVDSPQSSPQSERPPRPKAERLGYRPELDGIRGGAIALVVIGHLIPGAPGAWVGVQLFFVLSGYLITSLLVAEHARTGRIDLAAFWVRRARRLLPALVALLAVMALAGVPNLLAGGSYLANWIELGGADLGPMAHTWSLAIEEQFYLVWPLIAIPLLRHRRLLAMAVVVIFLVRFATPFGWTYYATPLRADGLLLGALLAMTGVRWSWRLGLAALAAAFALIPYSSAWLAVGLALTTLGAGAIVSSPPRWLAWRPLVWLGGISYALYLWHWPLLVLLGPIGIPLAVLAAVVSGWFVERPLRLRRDDAEVSRHPGRGPASTRQDVGGLAA